MQQGALLAENSMDGYRPLGAFGQPVHKSYVQLRAAVAQRLNSRCANLFARPQIDERSRTIRWVSPIAGESQNWVDLAPEEQAERALDLQIIRGEFESYLAELRSVGGNGDGEALASVLDQALKTPNDRHLHFVGDQPVMTFWGFTELNGDAFEALSATPPPDPVVPEASSPPPPISAVPIEEEPPRRRFPAWLFWLIPLLLLLLLLLLWWLFWWDTEPPLVLPEPPVREEVPVEPEEEPVVPPDEWPVIRDRDGRIIDYRELHVDEMGRVIGPDGEVIDGVRPEDLPPLPVDDQGLEGVDDPAVQVPEGEENLPAEQPGLDPGNEALPDETEANEPPKPEEPEGIEPPRPGELEETEPQKPEETEGIEPPNPEELQPEPETGMEEENAPTPGEPLTLPPPQPKAGGEGATGGSDNSTSAPVDFLRGRWRSRSALTDEQGNQLDQTYQFDAEGKGRSIIRRADGTECTAPAQAQMENGKLRIIEQGNPTCSDGQRFEKSETVCETDASGQTRCRGAGYDVQIERSGP